MHKTLCTVLVALVGLGVAAVVGTSDELPLRRGAFFDRGGPNEPPPPPPQGGPPHPGNPLVKALDTNRDGIISEEELKNATASLKKLDRNKDGKLTPDELRPEREGRQGPPPQERRGDRRGPGDRPHRFEDGPGPGGRPPHPPVELGAVLPPFVRDGLDLSAKQETQLKALEKEVKAKLEKILTKEQRSQVDERLKRGPQGPPPPRGRDFNPPPPGKRPPGPDSEEE